MNIILPINKSIGQTPLQVVEMVRDKFPEYRQEKIGYAGRLDPLAHGVLLLMIGDATKERETYLDLPKEYTFEVLLGVETDTYDILGLITSENCHPGLVSGSLNNKNVNLLVSSFVNKHIGKMSQSYPPYSSKTVQGKPLFWWAKQKRLAEISIPTREITISNFAVRSYSEITREDLQNRVTTNIKLVQGEFRQKEITERWDEFFTKYDLLPERSRKPFQTISCTISCSSGTYVRGLAYDLGKTLGCGALALDILRTKIGKYTLGDSLILKSQQ